MLYLYAISILSVPKLPFYNGFCYVDMVELIDKISLNWKDDEVFEMNIRLYINALMKFVLGIVLIGLLLFLPAWTFNYPSAWLFIGILFIPMFIIGIVLMIKNPKLLEKRLNAKEKEKEQSLVIKLSGLIFVVGFILAALDFRFSWLQLPSLVSYIAVGVFLLAYLMYAEVLRENSYLSRTVEVQKGQKVIDTGFYGIIRHPMYSVTVLLFLSIPLILGSIISFVVFGLYPLIIVKRINNEEKVLELELDGYVEYKQKVKYKLIPFIW